MAGQKVTTTTKIRIKKDGSTNSGGYRQCNMCRGTGIVKKAGQKTTKNTKGRKRR